MLFTAHSSCRHTSSGQTHRFQTVAEHLNISFSAELLLNGEKDQAAEGTHFNLFPPAQMSKSRCLGSGWRKEKARTILLVHSQTAFSHCVSADSSPNSISFYRAYLGASIFWGGCISSRTAFSSSLFGF